MRLRTPYVASGRSPRVRGELAAQVVGTAQRGLAARPPFHSARGALASPRAAGCGRRARPRRCPCFGWVAAASARALRSPFSAAISCGGGTNKINNERNTSNHNISSCFPFLCLIILDEGKGHYLLHFLFHMFFPRAFFRCNCRCGSPPRTRGLRPAHGAMPGTGSFTSCFCLRGQFPLSRPHRSRLASGGGSACAPRMFHILNKFVNGCG